MLDVEGAVGDLLWRTLIVVVAGAELLGFDVCRFSVALVLQSAGRSEGCRFEASPSRWHIRLCRMHWWHARSAAGTDQTR